MDAHGHVFVLVMIHACMGNDTSACLMHVMLRREAWVIVPGYRLVLLRVHACMGADASVCLIDVML